MKSVNIIPSPLQGSITIPSSKSLCHRAIIAAAMAKGTSNINNVVLSEDILATIEAVKALGAEVKIIGSRAYIKGTDFSNTADTVDCRESGSTLRFIIPLGLLSGNSIKYIGSSGLSARPLAPYLEIFEEQGIKFDSTSLPINIQGTLKSGDFKLKGNISSQFITGLMFALPMLDGHSSINVTGPLESKAYLDLTIDVLKSFGIYIENDNYKSFYIKGNQGYTAAEYSVEGDYSQAAFWIAAGVLGNQVVCKNLNEHSSQGDKTFIDILKSAGAKIIVKDGTVTSSLSNIKAFDADVSQFPDTAPILAVVAAFAEGTSRITGASRLRIKECDRLKAISTELNKLGAEIIEGEDYLIINGKKMLSGGVVDSWNDHRIAMALSIATIRCTSPVIINNSGAVAKSYPHFYEDFTELGGIINERSLGQ